MPEAYIFLFRKHGLVSREFSSFKNMCRKCTKQITVFDVKNSFGESRKSTVRSPNLTDMRWTSAVVSGLFYCTILLGFVMLRRKKVRNDSCPLGSGKVLFRLESLYDSWGNICSLVLAFCLYVW